MDAIRINAALISAIAVCSAGTVCANDSAVSLRDRMNRFLVSYCMDCHDASTTTRLNLQKLDDDLTNASTFRTWEIIHDQLAAGTMPPDDALKPDVRERRSATRFLSDALRLANEESYRRRGRVPARRLTRREYDYTVKDLFSIDGDFASLLPEESRAASFDTVGTAQHVSDIHLRSYLSAADNVLKMSIRLHANPFRKHTFDLVNNEHLNAFHEKELRLGGNISRKLDDGIAIFRDVDYLLRSDLHGFKVRSSGSGTYRIYVTARAFQSESPVAVKVVVKDINGQSRIVAARDLTPGETLSFVAEAHLTRTQVFYVAFVEERLPAYILADIFDAGGAENYRGRGAAIKSISVEGPLNLVWPPQSTRRLFPDVEFTKTENDDYEPQLSRSPRKHVRGVVAKSGPQLFRRPLTHNEVDGFVALADNQLAAGQDFVEVVQTPIRAMLSAPQFLFFSGPPGKLDDHDLAARLSYFLWKTVPDDQLMQLAADGKLSEPAVLTQQVNRLLDDDRFERFVTDFTEQWLRLDELEATTPDEKLYPEYDELLHWSIPLETRRVLKDLIRNDLSLNELIDSEFTFVNRRLAAHYGIEGVYGTTLRKVKLPPRSVRGGLLTQASVLKVTANGLVTSPVTRGDFLLTELLGTPPPPPPADVGSIEPDTSGAVTIRDALQRHRNVASCAKGHSMIDPPGFALESFDPTGAFRTHYRVRYEDILTFVNYQKGPLVDSSGVTPDGDSFSNVREFKSLLLMKHQKQLARHFISQLLVYSTGGEIEFADREEVDEILARTSQSEFPARTIVHEVVKSRIFRHR